MENTFKQFEAIILYLRKNGHIVPAKMAGVVWNGTMFGSETSKRCRELRQHTLPDTLPYPQLDSNKDGRFERFFIKREEPILSEAQKQEAREKQEFLFSQGIPPEVAGTQNLFAQG